MPERKFMTTLERPLQIKIMVNAAEKKGLVRIARKLDMPLATFIRHAAVTEMRRLEAGS